MWCMRYYFHVFKTFCQTIITVKKNIGFNTLSTLLRHRLSNFSDNVILIAIFLLLYCIFEVLVIGNRAVFISHDTHNFNIDRVSEWMSEWVKEKETGAYYVICSRMIVCRMFRKKGKTLANISLARRWHVYFRHLYLYLLID